MKKSIKTLAALVVLAVSFTSCTRESTPTPSTPLGDLRVEAAGEYEYFIAGTDRDNSPDTSRTSSMTLSVDTTSTTGMNFGWASTTMEVLDQDVTGFNCIITENGTTEAVARWNRASKTLVWLLPSAGGFQGEVIIIATKVK